MSLSPVASLLDYKAFQEAAEHFQPYIKFFATFDKGVSTYGNHFDTFSGMDNSSPSSFVASLSTSVRRFWKSTSEAVAPIFKPIAQKEKLTTGSNVTRIQRQFALIGWGLELGQLLNRRGKVGRMIISYVLVMRRDGHSHPPKGLQEEPIFSLYKAGRDTRMWSVSER